MEQNSKYTVGLEKFTSPSKMFREITNILVDPIKTKDKIGHNTIDVGINLIIA